LPPNRPAAQLYGADDRTAGVVAVGRQPGAMAWPPAGQMVPSQVILGLPQSGGMMRPLAGQGAVLAGGMDEATMMMGGYMGAVPPMYAAYPGPADYGMGGGRGTGGQQEGPMRRLGAPVLRCVPRCSGRA
jgi:hypothetical protein